MVQHDGRQRRSKMITDLLGHLTELRASLMVINIKYFRTTMVYANLIKLAKIRRSWSGRQELLSMPPQLMWS